MQKIYLFIVILTCCCYISTGQVGDKCLLKSTNLEGECKLGPDCPIQEEQAKRGIDITLCGFYGLTTPIVCCDTNLPQANENSFLPSSDIVYPERPVQIESNVKPRISKEKCEEYSRAVTGVVQVIPLVFNTDPINITVEKCDYNSVPLIVGGQPASPGEFPFMAAIGFDTDDEKWRCGGTLISEWFVLTAAHCTYTLDAGPPTVVRLGDLILSTTNDGSKYEDYAIKKVLNHPEYKYPYKYNDIALIKTETKVTFTRFIRPACLYIKGHLEHTLALATGWGKTDFASENSDKLMKVSLNIYDNELCYKPYKNNMALPRGIVSSMLCAGETRGGKDTCQGDSGGPLLITEEGNQCKFHVVGITSFGKSCGQINTPAIYTKVSVYVDWIEKTVW